MNRSRAMIGALALLVALAGLFGAARAGTGTRAAPAEQEQANAQPAPLRSRYAIGIGAGSPAAAATLGLEWMTWPPAGAALLGRGDASQLPAGIQFPFFLSINPTTPEADIRALAEQRPGAYWIVGNEPNLPPEFNVDPTAAADPDSYAQALNHYDRLLREIDPSARLVGPNVINWSFTCTGCPGFQSGAEWTAQMRDAYVRRYGSEPPFAVWAIHLYDLDWLNLPMGNADRQIAQIQELRAWLDGVPGLAGKPIWLTEVGVHWGYPSFEIRDGKVFPVGEFDFNHMERYMRTLYGWLNANAEAQIVERWFIWTSWGGGEERIGEFGGINLMTGPAADAAAARLGRLYQELAGIR